MRAIKLGLLTLCLLSGLAGVGAGAPLPDITTWGGAPLLSLLQSRINGEVTAGDISGNPITGLTFKDMRVTGPTGEQVFTADRLEIRLSLKSIPTFHLDLGALTLVKPRIHLTREKSRWTIGALLKPEAQPPKPAGWMDRIIAYFLRRADLPNLLVQKGEIIISREGQTQQYSDLDFTADLSLFNLGKPTLKVAVNRAELGVTTPQGRAELDTRLTYSPDLAELDRLNLKLAGQTVIALQGKVCRPLAEPACTLTGKVGPLAGDRINGFWSRWPPPWDLAGAINVNTTPTGGTLQIQGKIGQADYAVRGEVKSDRKPPVFNLEIDLKGLATAQLQEIKGVKAEQVRGLSPVNAGLRLKGAGLPWNPESLETRLTLTPFRHQELKVDKVEIGLSGNSRGQDLQAAVAGNFGAVTVNAQGRLLPLGEPGQGLSGDLTVQTVDLQPALVGAAGLSGTSLTGGFTGKFRLPPGFSPARLYLAGDLKARGRVANHPLQDLKASFVLEGQKLALARADVRLAGLTASLRGNLTPAEVDVTFQAALAGSRGLPLPPGAAFAALSAEGSLRGPWKAPQANLAAQVRKASFTSVTLESANLSGALAGWPPQAGSLQFLGSRLHTPAGDFASLQLSANGRDGRWQFQAAAASPKEPKFAAVGTADLRGRPLTLQVARITWDSRALHFKNKTPFQVSFSPGWEISPAAFQVDGGTVTIAALARDRELSGRLEVQDLSAGLLAPLGLPATGKLNGRLTLAGVPQTPSLDGQIALSAGKLKAIPIQALTTTLSYQAEQARIAGYLEIGPLRSRLNWRGSVPARLSLIPFAFELGRDGLDLHLHSERVNLSLLTLISNEVEKAEGPVDLSVEARGNPRLPRVSGYVRWSPGSVLVHQAGTPYRLIPGEIRLQGDKIVIPGLEVQSDGAARLSGEVDLGGPPQAQARLQADNFQLLYRGGNQVWTNGFIDVRGPLAALVAQGSLRVPKAQFRPSYFRSGMDPDVILVPPKPKPQKAAAGAAPDIYRNLRVNLSIDGSGNAWLIDPMGKVELAAHLKVKKEPDQPLTLGGEIRSLQGTLEIQERAFTVDRAILRLPGVTGKPITVEGKAVHEMDDITMVVTVNGTLANPQIRMESLPPLPPADILSYLVFGAPAATLTKNQYLALGAQQLGVLGGISTGKLSEILGSTIPFLSGIKVKSGMVAGRPTVGVGKDITKNVSIFAGRNLNEERGVYEQQVGLQYKVNKHLSVESQIGQRNSGADVFFNYDF